MSQYRFYYHQLAKGTTLFHGTRYNNTSEEILNNERNMPLWLSADRRVAGNYAAHKGRSRCLSFVTREELNLFDFSDYRNFQKLLRHVSSSDRSKLEYYVHRFMLFGNRAIFNTDYGLLSREISRIFCQLGIDGWYIPSGHIRETEDENTGGITYTSFHEEMLICQPWRVLSYQGLCWQHPL